MMASGSETPVKRQLFGVSNSTAVFAPPWEKPIIFEKMLKLTGKPTPRVCYIGAARGDNPARIEEYYRFFSKQDCHLAHLNITFPETEDFDEYFSRFDLVYIDGGSTKNLITLFKLWKIDSALKLAYENGVVMAGASAGLICWFNNCITDSLPSILKPLDGLGIIAGSATPHCNSRRDRKEVLYASLTAGELDFPAYAVDDGVALHFVDEELSGAYSLNSSGKLYVFTGSPNSIEERTISPKVIG